MTNEIDAFSDINLILVTAKKVSGDSSKMIGYASRLEDFLSGFTGEHFGEPRVSICLYAQALLHVDIKFLTLEELDYCVETPHILFDRDNQIQKIFDRSEEKFPLPDYQWIEDRFWIWIHYALLKIGRGEYLEALDFFGFLRMVVFGPLLHIKNGKLPRAVRKVETELSESDYVDLKGTIPQYERESLLQSLRNSVKLYRVLRVSLFDKNIKLQDRTAEKVMQYFDRIENQDV